MGKHQFFFAFFLEGGGAGHFRGGVLVFCPQCCFFFFFFLCEGISRVLTKIIDAVANGLEDHAVVFFNI